MNRVTLLVLLCGLSAVQVVGVLGALSTTSAASLSRDEEAKNAIVDRALEVVGRPRLSMEATNSVTTALDAENASVAITAADRYVRDIACMNFACTPLV